MVCCSTHHINGQFRSISYPNCNFDNLRNNSGGLESKPEIMPLRQVRGCFTISCWLLAISQGKQQIAGYVVRWPKRSGVGDCMEAQLEANQSKATKGGRDEV